MACEKHLILLISSVSFVSLIIIFGMAQTRDEFRQKYGAPGAKGHYVVRPGIGLSVKYKQPQKPSEMLIEPLDSVTADVSNIENNSNKVIPSDVAEELLDELVPTAKRGKKGKTMNAEFACTTVDYIDYEQVKINIVKRCEQQGAGTYSISIRWKE
jgi:hypothetical protein